VMGDVSIWASLPASSCAFIHPPNQSNNRAPVAPSGGGIPRIQL
jgi:hypothetical protein